MSSGSSCISWAGNCSRMQCLSLCHRSTKHHSTNTGSQSGTRQGQRAWSWEWVSVRIVFRQGRYLVTHWGDDIAQRRWTWGVIAGDSGWSGPRWTSPKGASAWLREWCSDLSATGWPLGATETSPLWTFLSLLIHPHFLEDICVYHKIKHLWNPTKALSTMLNSFHCYYCCFIFLKNQIFYWRHN